MKQQATGGATREAVKEYLQQYHMARERRRILERRHDVLARELKAPAPGSAYMTMPASHSAAESEGAVSVVFRLSEVEERIEAQRIAMPCLSRAGKPRRKKHVSDCKRRGRAGAD